MSRCSPKDPDSEEYFVWDCQEQILSGAGGTIATVDSTFLIEEGDDAVTFLTSPAVSADGYQVSRKLGGCTDGVEYKITMRYTTTAGETLDHSLEFVCANGVS